MFTSVFRVLPLVFSSSLTFFCRVFIFGCLAWFYCLAWDLLAASTPDFDGLYRADPKHQNMAHSEIQDRKILPWNYFAENPPDLAACQAARRTPRAGCSSAIRSKARCRTAGLPILTRLRTISRPSGTSMGWRNAQSTNGSADCSFPSRPSATMAPMRQSANGWKSAFRSLSKYPF